LETGTNGMEYHNGSAKKFKACLVARGNCQQLSIDCTETYAPTASLRSLHLILTTACLRKWPIALFDVSGAYLYSPIKEVVLLDPPTSFLPDLEGKVLYGFNALEVDQSFYVFKKGGVIIVIWMHFNDSVVSSNCPEAIWSFKHTICSQLDVKWKDAVSRIVGLECVFGEGEVTITQQCLANGILDSYPQAVFHHNTALPQAWAATNSGRCNVVLVSDQLPVLPAFCRANGTSLAAIRPPSWLPPQNPPHGHCIEAQDALPQPIERHRLGGDLERSQTSFILKIGDEPILWGSKCQSVVALLTCMAEYGALSDSTQHLVQAIAQLSQLQEDFPKTIYCDSQAVVQVSIDNQSHKRMQYLDHMFIFVNNVIQKHGIKVVWIKTQDMQADAMTKCLSGPLLISCLSFLAVKRVTSNILGEGVKIHSTQ
ncbi:hypothetical protein O181_118306, partial [Austropuccinia psidii MF-1]|nr:hypothetical protein [Austropuccinia psidii MF-1]